MLKHRQVNVLTIPALLLALFVGASHADEEAADEEVVKAKAEPFRVEVELKGTLQPDRVATIRVEPEEWTTLKVAEIADQGAAVEKGDLLLRFETDGIDKQIQSLEFSVRLAELAFEQTRRELALLEKTAPLDLELAKRTKAEADDAREYFQEVDKALQIESANRSVDSSKFQLEYASEELDQLKKMYLADDLTEETEEIILKRTERQVESAEYFLKLAKIRNKRLLEVELPRREVTIDDTAVRADLALRRAEVTLPLAVDRKQIELAKQEFDLEQSRSKLEKLKADRDLLDVRSPVSGVVYHGIWDDGTWSLPATIKAQLKVGGTLPAAKPVMCVVRPQPLSLRTTVAEKDVAKMQVGIEGEVVPTAFPDTTLPCTVSSVAPYPVEPGKFAVEIDVETGDVERLVPGMTCTAKLVAYANDEAVVVPSKVVFEEDGRKVVYVVDGDEVESRVVRVGRTHGDKTEILAGLEADETVRTKKP